MDFCCINEKYNRCLQRYVNEKVKWNIKNCLFLYEEFTVKSLIGRDTDYGAVNHI